MSETEKPRNVYLIFDCDFGEKIFDLLRHSHVWIKSSKSNDAAVKKYLSDAERNSHKQPSTTISQFDDDRFDEELLEMIWDHHDDEYIGWPADQFIVLGISLNSDIRELVEGNGFRITRHEANSFEFRDTCTR